MSSRTIPTEYGTLELQELPVELFARVKERWPMGLIPDMNIGETCTGIVFQQGTAEVSGVKIQQPDYEKKEDAMTWVFVHSLHIALATGRYLEAGYGGILVAGTYFRFKDDKHHEPGLVLFPVPDPAGKECMAPQKLDYIDQALGNGSGNMVCHMVEAVAESGEGVLPSFQFIGIDVRKRLQMGNIRLDVLICGADVICLRRQVDPDDALWEYLVRGGVRSVFHMPSVPAAIPASDLSAAQPSALHAGFEPASGTSPSRDKPRATKRWWRFWR